MRSSAALPSDTSTTPPALVNPEQLSDAKLHKLVHNLKAYTALVNSFLRKNVNNDPANQYSDKELEAIPFIYDKLDEAVFDLSSTPDTAERIYTNKLLFNILDDDNKLILGGECADIAIRMIKDGVLSEFPPLLVNKLVFSYVCNVRIVYEDKIYRQLGKFVTFGNPAQDDLRKQVCFMVASTPTIMEMLTPAVTILLIALLKRHKNEFLRAYPSASEQLLSDIDNAFALNVNQHVFFTSWENNPWPALGGFENVQCANHYVILLKLAFKKYPPAKESPDEAEAAALILVQDKLFSANLSVRYSKRKKTLEERGLGSERFGLAMAYKSVAKLILEKPEFRGIKGEITDNDLKLIRESFSNTATTSSATTSVTNTSSTLFQRFRKSSRSTHGHKKVKRKSREVKSDPSSPSP